MTDSAASRPNVVPDWAPRLPNAAAVAWGGAYAFWGVWKLAWNLTLTEGMCEPPPIGKVALPAAFVELALGLLTAWPRTRRRAAIAAFAMNVGLVGFALVGDSRGLDWRACGCFFGGVDAPWLPWHALLAGSLALPFLVVFLDAERRAAAR